MLISGGGLDANGKFICPTDLRDAQKQARDRTQNCPRHLGQDIFMHLIPDTAEIVSAHIPQDDQSVPFDKALSDRLHHQFFKIRMHIADQINVVKVHTPIPRQSNTESSYFLILLTSHTNLHGKS